MVDADDLVGVSEIVERLNLKSSEAVLSWRQRYPDFPQPVARLADRFVWAFSDIETWAEATGQPRGSRFRRG